ncbi:MAG: PAS domain S-box protein [Thermoplasmatales archaeon]|nr:MAG: PAS domain S-box protein [Thermoplasmatales archaeon]
MTNKKKLDSSKNLNETRSYVNLEKITKERKIADKIFKQFFDNGPEYSYIVSTEGLIIDVNRAALKALGYRKAELIGKPLKTIYAPESLSKMQQIFEKWKKIGHIRNKEIVIMTKKGGRRTVLLSAGAVRDSNGKIQYSVSIQRDITERKKIGREKEKLLHDLGERVKELNYLYGLSKLVERSNITLEEIYQGAVDLIPPSWQYPDITCARIIIDNKEFKTLNCMESKFKQFADIRAYGKIVGVIEVYYLEKRPIIDEGPFLKEERKLLDAIAERLGRITERKKAEIRLRESEQRYSLAQRAANIGSWDWDILTDDLIWSEQIEPLFGFSKGKFGGTYRAFLDCVHPEDLQFVIDSINACVKHGKDYAIEHRIVWPDGTVRWVSETGDVIRDDKGMAIRMLGVVHDITKRKKAEDAVKVAYTELDQIFNTAADGMRVIDKNFNILRINDTFAKLVGIDKDKAVGKKCYDVFPGSQCHTPRCPLTQILNGKEYLEYEVKKERSDGTKIDCIVSITPFLGHDGELLGIVEDFKDITDRKKSEVKIKKLNEDLTRQTVELTAINKELEAFSYSVSHDLRAPLRSIDGFSQALLEDYEDKLDEQGKDYLRRVRKSTQRMGQLIDDMLKLSRLTRSEMHYEEVDLSKLARSVSEQLQKTEPSRNVNFIINDGLTTKGDNHLLQIALENLFGNAWKFTKRQSNAKIEMGKTIEKGKQAFFIRDNGVGFNMKYADKLFVPFQRLHPSDEFPGTGIGLGIVSRIIHKHGGYIWAEAEVGKHATFYFTLES